MVERARGAPGDAGYSCANRAAVVVAPTNGMPSSLATPSSRPSRGPNLFSPAAAGRDDDAR